jgi:ABC-2 type transport system permease protein
VKDAQSLAAPVTLLTFVPLMLWWVVMFNPNSALSLTLSFIPPMTPFVMILRICADPKLPAWQIVASLALLWASVVASIWFASRVFRVGVLMYGKAPSLRELAKWVRYA